MYFKIIFYSVHNVKIKACFFDEFQWKLVNCQILGWTSFFNLNFSKLCYLECIMIRNLANTCTCTCFLWIHCGISKEISYKIDEKFSKNVTLDT